MLYARVFTQILDSSLADDWQARHVFEDLLKLADDGVVDMTRHALARRTNVPIDVINAALAVLESPDRASRDPGEDGRRIIRLDSHRDWGWRIVNWQKYEAIRTRNDQREQNRQRVNRYREAKRQSHLSPAPPISASDSDADADAGGNGRKRRVTNCSTTVTKQARKGTATSAVVGEQVLKKLAGNAAYRDIDLDVELGKFRAFAESNKRAVTEAGFVSWLNHFDPAAPANAASNRKLRLNGAASSNLPTADAWAAELGVATLPDGNPQPTSESDQPS